MIRTLKQLGEEWKELDSLKAMIETWEEVAAQRMNAIRSAVLNSRDFTNGLHALFPEIKSAWRKEQLEAGQLLPKNDREVAVLVSANSGFYGPIIEQTWRAFAEHVGNRQTDIILLGAVGKQMMVTRMGEKAFDYFEFSDERVDMSALGEMMERLVEYERVFIFHGVYRSLTQQEVVTTPLHGVGLEELGDQESVKVSYLFEPTRESITSVFEGEILTSVYTHTLHEAQLAKFAARMMHLDEALGSIEEEMGKTTRTQRNLVHHQRNKKQLQRAVGVAAWNDGR